MIRINKKNVDQEDIVILIPPWKAPKNLFSKIKRTMPAHIGYIEYAYTDDMLQADPYVTKQNILELVSTINKDIEALNYSKKRNISLYGVSLGTLFCMIVADTVNVSKVRLVLPGANLAESVWCGRRTRYLKKRMQGQGITVERLKNIWELVSPDYYFKHHSLSIPFSIVLSTHDYVIPTAQGRALIDILRAKKVRFEFVETSLYHIPTCLKDAWFTKKFYDWLLGDK
jgi:esterase/lipase